MEFDHSGRAGQRSRSGLFVDVRRIRWRRAALEQRKRDTKARYQRRGAQRHHDQSLFLALFQIVHPDLRRRSGFVPLLVDRAEFHSGTLAAHGPKRNSPSGPKQNGGLRLRLLAGCFLRGRRWSAQSSDQQRQQSGDERDEKSAGEDGVKRSTQADDRRIHHQQEPVDQSHRDYKRESDRPIHFIDPCR